MSENAFHKGTYNLDEPVFKWLVREGYIASTTEAKRLIKDGAVALHASHNKHSDKVLLTMEHRMQLIVNAAVFGLSLRIGKIFFERLSLEGTETNDTVQPTTHH